MHHRLVRLAVGGVAVAAVFGAAAPAALAATDAARRPVAAAAAQPSLKLLSLSSYADSSTNSANVVGEVRNVGRLTCGDCAVKIELLDSSGHLVTSPDSSPNPVVQPLDSYALDPGHNSAFHLTAFGDSYPGVASYKVLALRYGPSYDPGNQNFAVTNVQVTPDGGLGYKVTGTVTNLNKTSVDTPSIYGVWRDASGNVIDSQIYLDTAAQHLAAHGASGDSTTFEIDQDSGAPGHGTAPSSFVFNSFSDPSPMRPHIATPPSKRFHRGQPVLIGTYVYKGASIGGVKGLTLSLQRRSGRRWVTLTRTRSGDSGLTDFRKQVFRSDVTLRIVTSGKRPVYLPAHSRTWTLKIRS